MDDDSTLLRDFKATRDGQAFAALVRRHVDLVYSVARLKREDRDALALRYMQGRSVADVAAALGVSQDAAQKRLGRALERLRESFARRGVRTSADALSSL